VVGKKNYSHASRLARTPNSGTPRTSMMCTQPPPKQKHSDNANASHIVPSKNQPHQNPPRYLSKPKNANQLVNSRQPLRRRRRGIRCLWRPRPQVARDLRCQNRVLVDSGSLSGEFENNQ